MIHPVGPVNVPGGNSSDNQAMILTRREATKTATVVNSALSLECSIVAKTSTSRACRSITKNAVLLQPTIVHDSPWRKVWARNRSKHTVVRKGVGPLHGRHSPNFFGNYLGGAINRALAEERERDILRKSLPNDGLLGYNNPVSP